MISYHFQTYKFNSFDN